MCHLTATERDDVPPHRLPPGFTRPVHLVCVIGQFLKPVRVCTPGGCDPVFEHDPVEHKGSDRLGAIVPRALELQGHRRKCRAYDVLVHIGVVAPVLGGYMRRNEPRGSAKDSLSKGRDVRVERRVCPPQRQKDFGGELVV